MMTSNKMLLKIQLCHHRYKLHFYNIIIKKIVISHFFISFHNFDVLPYFTQINGKHKKKITKHVTRVMRDTMIQKRNFC